MTARSASTGPAVSRPAASRPTPTRTRLARALALTAVTAVVLNGCAGVVTSRGEPVTEEREVSDVHAVTLAAVGSLTVSTGATPSLTITADEGVLGRITSEVDDGHLVLGLPGRLVNVGAIHYDLVVPRLDEVQVDGAGAVRGTVTGADALTVGLSGAGSVDLAGVDVDSLLVTIEGTGSVDLTGRAGQQEVRIDGAGNYRGHDLDSQDATVAIAGVGAADVLTTGTLAAEISGAGSITYAGDPEVTTRLDGVGRVTRR